MLHSEWVESVKATGGVSNDEKDLDAAITGAANFIWALLETRNIARNSFIQSGIPYVAGYMVSCAMHEDSDIWELNRRRDDYRILFRQEAEKNIGLLEALLRDAAQVAPRALHAYLVCSGVEFGLSASQIEKRRRTI